MNIKNINVNKMWRLCEENEWLSEYIAIRLSDDKRKWFEVIEKTEMSTEMWRLCEKWDCMFDFGV
jgi:hypothetical protein